ncbi:MULTISPECIES: helix-turn-helix domain-containing protein [Streptomyces]|uniref:helix-turn-helix domain-containing protein n=1 Tax=Streptomyces TaxID=1883 RepID=UPI001AE1479D|nr:MULTISPECIES: helix-turn-helix domain-containing protein [Streptomyces]MDX2748430.1 helix-turn-helix domain-containing protein [Streptomyces sp. NRRL_B-2557]
MLVVDLLAAVDAVLTRSPELPTPSARARLRKADGLTQQQVADLLGVRRLAVARWEAGKVEPREPHRQAYIRLLAGLAIKHPLATGPDTSNLQE